MEHPALPERWLARRLEVRERKGRGAGHASRARLCLTQAIGRAPDADPDERRQLPSREEVDALPHLTAEGQHPVEGGLHLWVSWDQSMCVCIRVS